MQKSNPKLLHIAFLNNYSAGVCQQMYWKHLAARELNLNWDTLIFLSNAEGKKGQVLVDMNLPIRNRIIRRIIAEKNFFHHLIQLLKNYRIILLRYNVCSYQQFKFLNEFPKKNIFTVHHTKELEEINLIFGFPFRKIEEYLGNKSISLAHGIVGVTEEIISYEKERIKNPHKLSLLYPNGTLWQGDKVMKRSPAKIPTFVFVATHFSPWHGLDLLIESASKTSLNFRMHVVGNLPDALKKSISKDYRFLIHGELESNRIYELFEESWLGLSSFALYRKGMKQATPLKVREYLMSGLPVYAGHKDIFPNDFEYFIEGAPSIEKIIEVGEKLKSIPAHVVSSESRPYIDKIQILRNLYKRIIMS